MLSITSPDRTTISIEKLLGQAHEGMTTAPHLYANAVSRFLLDSPLVGASLPTL